MMKNINLTSLFLLGIYSYEQVRIRKSDTTSIFIFYGRYSMDPDELLLI